MPRSTWETQKPLLTDCCQRTFHLMLPALHPGGCEWGTSRLGRTVLTHCGLPNRECSKWSAFFTLMTTKILPYTDTPIIFPSPNSSQLLRAWCGWWLITIHWPWPRPWSHHNIEIHWRLLKIYIYVASFCHVMPRFQDMPSHARRYIKLVKWSQTIKHHLMFRNGSCIQFSTKSSPWMATNSWTFWIPNSKIPSSILALIHSYQFLSTTSYSWCSDRAKAGLGAGGPFAKSGLDVAASRLKPSQKNDQKVEKLWLRFSLMQPVHPCSSCTKSRPRHPRTSPKQFNAISPTLHGSRLDAKSTVYPDLNSKNAGFIFGKAVLEKSC